MKPHLTTKEKKVLEWAKQLEDKGGMLMEQQVIGSSLYDQYKALLLKHKLLESCDHPTVLEQRNPPVPAVGIRLTAAGKSYFN